MNNGNVEEFDGISLIVWTHDNKIKSLKEFGCNLHNYNPYRDSDIPVFREEKANWFWEDYKFQFVCALMVILSLGGV